MKIGQRFCLNLLNQQSPLAANFHLHQLYRYFFFTSGPHPRRHPWSNTHLQRTHLKHLQNNLFSTQKSHLNTSLSLRWCKQNNNNNNNHNNRNHNICVFLCSAKAWLVEIFSRCSPKVSTRETSENPKQCSVGNIHAIKTWPCFPASVCTSLASSPSRVSYKLSFTPPSPPPPSAFFRPMMGVGWGWRSLFTHLHL